MYPQQTMQMVHNQAIFIRERCPCLSPSLSGLHKQCKVQVEGGEGDNK